MFRKKTKQTVVEQANSAIDTEALDVLKPVAPSDSPVYTASQITIGDILRFQTNSI